MSQGGACKKSGRNNISCKVYKATNQREKNKMRRLKRHLKRFPADECAIKAADAAKFSIRGF